MIVYGFLGTHLLHGVGVYSGLVGDGTAYSEAVDFGRIYSRNEGILGFGCLWWVGYASGA